MMTPDYFIYYFRVVSYYTKVRTKLLSKVIDSPTLLAYYSYCIDALSSDGKRQGALGRTGLRRCGSRTRKGCRSHIPSHRRAGEATGRARGSQGAAGSLANGGDVGSRGSTLLERWRRDRRSTLPETESGVSDLARSARQRAERSD